MTSTGRIQNEVKQVLRPLYNRIIIILWRMKGSPVPPPHSLKQDLLRKMKKKYRYSTLIETGTFKGDMIEAQRCNYKQLYTIELSSELVKKARERFKQYSHIEIIEGDSGVALHQLLRRISEPAVFWLDGHYSGGITAKGELNCPVFNELDAILTNPSEPKHIILIDDARFFIGKEDYPKISEIQEYILQREPRYKFSVKDDVILALP